MISFDKVKVVEALEPATNGSGLTGLYVSLKNVIKVHIICQITQGASNTVALTIENATAVAGTNHTAIVNVVNIWSNLDTGTSDTLVARTAAVNYTTDAGTNNKIVVFEFTPDILSTGYDCIAMHAGSSSASNIVSAVYVLETRYSGADLDAD